MSAAGAVPPLRWSGTAQPVPPFRASLCMPITVANAASPLADGEPDAPPREERSSIVRDAIQTLRGRQRVVLALHYFEELSLAQIAPVLGVTESGVGRIHRRALRTLRDALHAPLGLAA
jgi:DNA-directed RNA polymerase specialized sigma24 family protein